MCLIEVIIWKERDKFIKRLKEKAYDKINVSNHNNYAIYITYIHIYDSTIDRRQLYLADLTHSDLF